MLLDLFHFGGEYYNTGETSTDWPKWISVISGLLTLFLAFKIWKNYDVKKHFVKKQLDTVFDLYTAISTTKITIELHKGNEIKIQTILFGDIVTLLADIDMGQYLNTSPVYIDFRILHNIPFIKFIENPFTPKSIVSELEKFRSKIRFTDEPDEGDYAILELDYLIEHGPFKNKRILLTPKSDTYKSIGSYIRQALAVNNAIKNWLKKFEVNDMNLRHDRPIKLHGRFLHIPDE